jgi:hypothetical protein
LSGGHGPQQSARRHPDTSCTRHNTAASHNHTGKQHKIKGPRPFKLCKEITQTIGRGFGDPSQQWPLYAFIILEPIGFLLNQNAFQESTLIAPVLAIRTVTDPLVAIGIGLVFLNERIASGPADIAAEVVGLAIMSVGVYALAHRSPQLAAQTTAPT